MADTTASALKDAISTVKFDPTGIQLAITNHLRELTNGNINLVDATNPFVYGLEAASVCTAAHMQESFILTRKQYPSLAQTSEEVYNHMSDKDYINRFATPSVAPFKFRFLKNDLLNKMVDDPVLGGKKLIISKDTEIKLGDVYFTLQYPIVIRQLLHDSIQITYDTDELSDIQSLSTNVIPYDIGRFGDTNRQEEFISFEVNVYQFRIEYSDYPLVTGAAFNESIDFVDQFYLARVYYKNNSNQKYTEIKVTHSDQVYDAKVPTAILKVVDNNLSVFIPQIYLNTGLISGGLRICIYTTKGEININPADYNLTAFETNFRVIDTAKDSNVFTAPLPNIVSIIYTSGVISGGTNGLSFEQLRDRTINNTIGPQSTPITTTQLKDKLISNGFDIITNVDVVTNRTVLATRSLPKPFDEKLITAGSATIETLLMSMKELSTKEGVYNNGNRITITPNIIYKNTNGINTVIDKTEIQQIIDQGPDAVAAFIQNNNIFFTPFHYVLDANENWFDLRPYYLDAPELKNIKFIEQNESSGLQINTNSINIKKTDSGYTIQVYAKVNDAVKALDNNDVIAQLSFLPENEVKYAFVNSFTTTVATDGSRVFEFKINTDFDIDKNNKLYLKDFYIYENYNEPIPCDLLNTFRIVYSVVNQDTTSWTNTIVDSAIQQEILTAQAKGITLEEIKVEFGVYLKRLWARCRSVMGEGEYQRYTEVQYKKYTKKDFERDSNGQAFTVVFDPVLNDNKVVWNELHDVGDLVLDSNNQPIVIHNVGDVVVDENGDPVFIAAASINREFDLVFIEGAYQFATDTASAKYRKDLIATLVKWITVDLEEIHINLLEQTQAFFYPKKSAGVIQVYIANGKIINLNSAQSLLVDLYVTKTVHENEAVRKNIRIKTIKTIDTYLKKSTVSISEIIRALGDTYGDDVVSIRVSGLGGSSNYETFSVVNLRDSCSIKKRLDLQPDETLIVTEDISVNFIKTSA